MISIIIPTFNYKTLSLVKELYSQVKKENVDFEILVSDDASTNLNIVEYNSAINLLENCKIYFNSKNLGRGKNINSLVSKAKYDWLIILDCDLFPSSKNFISNYLNAIKTNNAPFYFGGILYKEEIPNEKEMLRWVYGKSRESIPVYVREQFPYKYALTSNILIEKKILLKTPFNSAINKYGFEDLVLVSELQSKNILIKHIENPLFHLNLEKSIVFIRKYQSSLNNLKFLIDSEIISYNATRISQLKEKIDFFPLNLIILKIYKTFENQLISNLTSKKPKLYLFDFYRLGYFLNLYRSK